jgi:hypothetical protein
MTKCLITKLNGTVDNDSILCIGEMKFSINKIDSPTKNTQYLSITSAKDITLKIIGDGYFTDENLSANNGKTKAISANDKAVFYLSNNNLELVIPEKYSLNEISDIETIAGNKVFKLEDFKFLKNISTISLHNEKITGDIASLKDLATLNRLLLIGTNIIGDIANFKNFTALTLFNLSNTNVSGDIANLKNLTALTSLGLSNTNVSGDIANLKNLTALTSLGLSNTNVSGDIANLKNLTKLKKELRFEKLNLSGNIGDIPNNVLFFTNQRAKSNFTWTTSSRTDILAMESIACDNIDKLLQDMSKMNANFAGEAVYYKTIDLIGTRTSASDAAVQTLQSKGYTVSVTPA